MIERVLLLLRLLVRSPWRQSDDLALSGPLRCCGVWIQYLDELSQRRVKLETAD